MGKLDGKVTIVTGGGTGIGKGIARAFAAEGAQVVITSRSEQTLNEVAGELGDQVLALPTDLKVEAQITALFERTIAEMGHLDILVNNAGVFEGGPIEELSLETWQHVMDVNLTGVFLCTREAMKIMKPAGGGRIINIGSISAQMPRMNSAPYSTTKHALVGLTKSTALEGRDFGVVASILHPGNVLTELRDNSTLAQNQEPMMSTDDIAMAALTMAALPLNVNMLESIVLPVEQKYIGRG
tara:strand:- start:21 stop:743 length:723 start_codon:yes stop_codon:yes gene_type:complete